MLTSFPSSSDPRSRRVNFTAWCDLLGEFGRSGLASCCFLVSAIVLVILVATMLDGDYRLGEAVAAGVLFIGFCLVAFIYRFHRWSLVSLPPATFLIGWRDGIAELVLSTAEVKEGKLEGLSDIRIVHVNPWWRHPLQFEVPYRSSVVTVWRDMSVTLSKVEPSVVERWLALPEVALEQAIRKALLDLITDGYTLQESSERDAIALSAAIEARVRSDNDWMQGLSLVIGFDGHLPGPRRESSYRGCE